MPPLPAGGRYGQSGGHRRPSGRYRERPLGRPRQTPRHSRSAEAVLLEHFPLVLSTRPWYFSRRGGADGRGVLNGSADARAEGLRRGAVVEGASRSVLREARVGRRREAKAAGDRLVRAAQAHKI